MIGGCSQNTAVAGFHSPDRDWQPELHGGVEDQKTGSLNRRKKTSRVKVTKATVGEGKFQLKGNHGFPWGDAAVVLYYNFYYYYYYYR